MLKKNKSFKYLFLGRLFSNAGDSLYYVVISWYIMSSTNSSFWVGIVNFSIFIPNLFSFIFGKYIDSGDKKKILLFLEFGQLFFLIILMGSLIFSLNNPIYICVIAFCMSMFASNTYTVQDSLLPIIVKENDLTKANQYMSVAYNTSDYLFNALTGFLISIFSYVNVLLIDVISFIISIFCFTKIEYTRPEYSNMQDKDDFWAGFKIIKNNKSIMFLVFAGSLGNFMFGGFSVYQVIIASSNKLGSIFYGIMLAIISLGIVVGNSFGVNFLLNKLNIKHGKIMIVSELFLGLLLAVSGLVVDSLFILFMFFLFSIFLGIKHVIFPVFYQVNVNTKDLGKFYSASYLFELTAMPIGALFFGYFAKYISPNLFMILFGLFYILFSIIENNISEIKRFEVSKLSNSDMKE